MLKQIHLLLDADSDPVFDTWTKDYVERIHDPRVITKLKARIVTYLQQKEELKTKQESSYDYEL